MRSQFNESLIDSSGNALEGIDVTVLVADTDSEATIYGQRTGGSAVSNPFTTGSDGHAQFWAEPGTYKIVFEDTEVPKRVDDRTIYWEAVSGEAVGVDKGIIGDQLVDEAINLRTLHPEVISRIMGGAKYAAGLSSITISSTDNFSSIMSIDVDIEERSALFISGGLLVESATPGTESFIEIQMLEGEGGSGLPRVSALVGETHTNPLWAVVTTGGRSSTVYGNKNSNGFTPFGVSYYNGSSPGVYNAQIMGSPIFVAVTNPVSTTIEWTARKAFGTANGTITHRRLAAWWFPMELVS